MARNYSSLVEPKALAADITSTSATTITLNNTTGLPSPPYVLVINPDTASEEVVLVTSNASSPTLTVTRAIEASGGLGIAKTHTSGNVVKHMIVGSDLQIVHDHFSDNSLTAGTAHGVTGGVVGRTSNQILTTKTIALGSNTITGTKAEFNTAMTDADFVTIAGTETLTAKTLTAPTITSPTISGTITGAVVTSANIVDGTIVNADINASAAIDWTKLAISSTVSATELGYVDGVTSAIQTQLDGKVTTPGAWSSWTPTLGNLTLGSGSTATYKYNQVGKTVNFSIDITFAGTSSGSSGNTITFTLPVTASGNYKGVFASGGYASASGSAPLVIFGLLSSGSTTVMRLNYPVSGSFGSGMTYGSFALGSSITAGAYLQIAGTYEAA
jgi:hypothetical protein